MSNSVYPKASILKPLKLNRDILKKKYKIIYFIIFLLFS